MVGLFLVLAATFFAEAQDSIGKHGANQGRLSIYSMGFLSLLWGFFFFAVIIAVKREFIFSTASLPTFLVRAALEVLLIHTTLLAMTRADRSTFGFIRVGTLPLLLIVDIYLGYTLRTPAVLGITIIIIGVLLFSLWHRAVGKEGVWLVALTAVLAVATLSLYKYNITHFNSIEAEQSSISLILLVYLFMMARIVAKENPFAFLRQPIFLFQSLSAGLGDVLASFAYLFGAASVITAARRALAVLWSIVSGNLYFKERGLLIKLAVFFFILVGLVMTAL